MVSRLTAVDCEVGNIWKIRDHFSSIETTTTTGRACGMNNISTTLERERKIDRTLKQCESPIQVFFFKWTTFSHTYGMNDTHTHTNAALGKSTHCREREGLRCACMPYTLLLQRIAALYRLNDLERDFQHFFVIEKGCTTEIFPHFRTLTKNSKLVHRLLHVVIFKANLSLDVYESTCALCVCVCACILNRPKTSFRYKNFHAVYFITTEIQ